jgi:uncharacterized membrane protein (UPF0127 family)
MRAGVLVITALLGCSENHRAELIDPAAPVRVRIAAPGGEVAVTVEVADVPATVKRGMSNRVSLPAGTGMLFFMDREKNWSFWMHDTKIPLDIVFITKQRTVTGVIHDAVPMSDEKLYVGGMSLYVLEVNGGWAAKHGVAAGQRVRFDNIKD